MPEVLALIVAAAARLIAPLNEALPPVFVRAPPDETPVPRRVIVSDVPRVKPFRSKAAPATDIVVPATVVPKGPLMPSPLAPSFNVPALIVVKPVYELFPASSIPSPALVKATVPLIIPEIVN